MEKVSGILFDNGLGFGNGVSPFEKVVVHDLVQIVHIVQKDVGLSADFGFHVSRNRQIEYEERAPLVGLSGVAKPVTGNERVGSGCRRDQDVGLRQLERHFVEVNRTPRKFVGELTSPVVRPVGYHQPPDAVPAQSLHHQLRGRTGPEDHHLAPFETAEDLSRQPHGYGSHRGSAFSDGGRRTNTPTGGEGGLKKPVEDGSRQGRRSRTLPRQFISILDLSLDLGLTEHQRVQPPGDAVEVADRRLAVEVIQVLTGPADYCARFLGKKTFCRILHPLVPSRAYIEFGAIARGEQYGLTHFGPSAKTAESGFGLLRPKREPFPNLDWRRQVTDTDDTNRTQRKNPPCELTRRKPR
jgi:hypothetical protein